MMTDYSQFCSSNSTWSVRHISCVQSVELFQIHFKPELPSPYPPIVFLPGWGSLINSWDVVLKEMTIDFEIFYIETREKKSAKHDPEQPITIETIGDDLTHVIRGNNLNDRHYILMGSSLGATAILDAISRKQVDPSLAVLIGPNGKFKAPWYILTLTWLAHPLVYHGLKPIMKWILKKKYLDVQSDPEQYEKYARSIDEAHPGRIRRSALQFSGYKIWEELGNIHQKCVIFTGSKDKLHVYEDTVRINEGLQNCQLIDLETNAKTHGIKMVNQLKHMLREDYYH